MINKNEAIKNNIKVIDNSIKNELFENLKTNFPQTIIEGKADLKAISLLLGLDKKSDISGYELTWTGKGLSNALYSSPCNKELKLEEIFSNTDCKNLNSSNIEMKDSNNPKNIIIRGDNLDVLKILKSAYSEKIKMIYIDPPYNTTNENFIYPDNFRQDYKKILEEVGLIEIDENGQEVESEDLKFFKNIQGSRTHSGWLSFMLPRLKLARDLLKEDGVIFISIDDNEQANLKLLCDEIFGEDNFVANIIWHSKNKPSGNTTENKTIDTRTEHILCYQKSYFLANKYENTKDELKEKGYILKDEFFKTRGYYKLTPLMRSCSASSFKYIESLDYEVKAPDGTIFKNHQNIKKPKSYCYTWSKKLFDFGNANGFIEIQKTSDGFWCIYRKMYEFCAIDNKKLEIVYRKSGNAYNNLITGIYSDIGANEVRNLMGGEKIFTYAKPINLIKTLLQISTTPNSNDIILDFFAGSGTTAQAVMELNAEDKGNREFILVQIDEEIKEDKSKSAYDFCKKELKSENPVISDITIERVKRASQKIIQSSKDNDLNLGFKVFTLEDKPEIIIDKDKNLKLINRRNLSVIDKVVNMFLISGKTLDKKIENIFDGKLYKCEDSFYLISFNKEILKYLIKTQNEYIFIDAYGDIELEDFLNLGAGFKERLKVVY
ncbi:site-specific DNA-methyltransferase [Brachyspira aalborgi]|uniref:site-specific DNA-methyltransferase (adenine-specific) n=2 Tax=Pseudomonadati TaxID=3379134 RepID=A0AB38PZG5_9SPIR|nr:site-specific DNA-methyltransferase [Brachyspira aalborgi]TXJ26468.1 site-specific DNA-methyltransferase [Brachyspira aalborgi]